MVCRQTQIATVGYGIGYSHRSGSFGTVGPLTGSSYGRVACSSGLERSGGHYLPAFFGYVDHQEFVPGPALFRHFIEQVRGLTGSVYGRRMYEVMRSRPAIGSIEDHPDWTPELRDFAAAWRSQPRWVVSRSLKSVGPNATLVEEDIEAVIRGLKDELAGEIEVGGPDLARSLTELGLIDEYRLYFRPVVFGHGKPFFAGPRPPLRLVANDLIGEDAIRLTYIPA